MVSCGLNGVGRFGLHFLRYWLEHGESCGITIDYLNDPKLDLSELGNILESDAYLNFSKYDLVLHDTFISLTRGGFEHRIQFSNEPTELIPWIGLPDLFLECSGAIAQDYEQLLALATNNTKRVIVSQTSWVADQTIIFGFNHETLHENSRVISYGSCTVNAFVPLASWVNDRFGVSGAEVNIIHNVPRYQLERYRTPKRRFCTLEKSGPRLLDFIAYDNFRVNYTLIPYTGPSSINVRFQIREKGIEANFFFDELNQALEVGPLKSLYGCCAADSGPDGVKFSRYSAEFIRDESVSNNTGLHLYGYFDNENSCNRFFDLVNFICEAM